MSAPPRRVRRTLLWTVLIVALLSGGALAVAGGHIAGEQAAFTSPIAAKCVPAQLNVSDVLAHTSVQVSPLPGSYDAMPQTQISFLGVPASDIEDISADGSLTRVAPRPPGGLLAGRRCELRAGSAHSSPARCVTVSGQIRSGGATVPFTYAFGVAVPRPDSLRDAARKPAADAARRQRAELSLGAGTAAAERGREHRIGRASRRETSSWRPYSGPGPNGPTIYTQQGQLDLDGRAARGNEGDRTCRCRATKINRC